MRLLIITQKVDKNDPILGFFHNWILKLSQKFEFVTVICLQKGEVSLPNNVKVLSLGKENGESKIKYVINFYKYIWRERKNYDAVFVHMNQEYVLLGGLYWKFLGKKVYMWRNHSYGNLLTRVAVFLSDHVFCTSPHSYTARFPKTEIMPVGIDTDEFIKLESSKVHKVKNSILFLGRIAPVKRPDLLIEALQILRHKNLEFLCNFYGDALSKDQKYFNDLKNKVKEYGLDNNVKFNGAVANYETPKIYNEHQIFINLTPSGSLDKTILEAASSGSILIVLNEHFKDIFESEMITLDDAEDLSAKIEYWLKAREDKIEVASLRLQKYVLENHSLNALIEKLCIPLEAGRDK